MSSTMLARVDADKSVLKAHLIPASQQPQEKEHAGEPAE